LKKHHDADLTLIVTGISINADDAYGFETYSYYSKKKVYDLIRANKRSGVIFLTGDVHYAIPTASACKDAIGGGYKVPEFVSSGLTHTDQDFLPFAP